MDFIFEYYQQTFRFGRIRKKAILGIIFYKYLIRDNSQNACTLMRYSGCLHSIRNSGDFNGAQCIIRTKSAKNLWHIEGIRKIQTSGNMNSDYWMLSLSSCMYYKYNRQNLRIRKSVLNDINIWNRDIELIRKSV